MPVVFAVVSVGIFCLLMLLEHLSPLRERTRPRAPRLVVNLTMTAGVFAAGALAVDPTARALTRRVAAQPFGLLYLAEMPSALRFVMGFVLMDLAFYYWHRANHCIPLLWRFHNVHHCDPDMDVSTAFRFHVVEVLYSIGFRVLQVAIIGVSPSLYVIYGVAFQCAVMLHHSNLRLPLGLERWLSRAIVTPRMHGVHHSVNQPETDSNYASILSCWDRVHRTLCLHVPQRRVIIGMAAYSTERDNQLWPLFKMPFVEQREYSLWPDGSRAERAAGLEEPDPRVMAA